MKIKSLIKHNLMRAAMTLALIMTCATAWAETVETYYIDENGTRHDVTATVVTTYMDNLGTDDETTWYVVNENVFLYDGSNNQTHLHGNVNLIIADGCELKPACGSNGSEDGFRGSGNLTLYGQTAGTGTLSCGQEGFMNITGDFTVCSGMVSVSGYRYNAIRVANFTMRGGSVSIENNTNNDCGIRATGTVNIYDGSVEAEGTNGIEADIVNIYGGSVTARCNGRNAPGSNYGHAIKCSSTFNFYGGNVTAQSDLNLLEDQTRYGIYANGINLSWTSTADWIYNTKDVNSNNVICYFVGSGGMNIAPYKPFTDGTTTYTGTLTDEQVEALADKTLQPAVPAFAETGNGTPEHPYTIWNAIGWSQFCDALQDATYNHFSGKTVKLGADISIRQSAGSAGHEFMGTFDGDGKTLTVDITETTTQGTAPFREIKGATIQNLVVTGSVDGTTHAAGLVGFARGADASTVNTITNCKVATNVTVTTPNSAGNYHCGGVVGHALQCTLNMSNTVYCGDITNSGNYVGGLQGWSDGNTINFSHCLFVGSYSGTASFHPVAVRNNNSTTTASVSHVYYTVTPTLTNSNFIAANGTKTISRATAPATIGDQTQSLNFMSTTIYQNGICYNDLYYATIGLPSGGTDIYLIDNADDWLYFCDMLNDNATWNRFIGKTVKLDANISVTQSAGSPNHDFCGTFDGQNNTLTFTATATANYLAPFRYVSGTGQTNHAVIQNLDVVTNITATDFRHAAGLIADMSSYVDVTNCNVTANITANKGNTQTQLFPAGLVSQVANGSQLTVSGCTVSGTISTDGKFAGGMVGIVQGSANITNSVSSVTINSSTDGDGTHGGFVASLVSDCQLTIEGCVFNGKIVTTNGLTTKCGGFLGHDNTNGGTGATITNCLYAPAADPNTVSTDCATFGRNVNSDFISNCYYTTALGDAQGTQAYSITAGDYVTTLANAGTVSNNYTTSGLIFYNVGLKYGDVLYAAENDVVSLTLAHQDREGYDFIGYTATAGNLNGSTLTMLNEDVIINATFALIISYIDENGETQQCTNYTLLTGTETTLGTAGQETWCVVHSTLNYSQGIQLLGNTHIILCDGAEMTVTGAYTYDAISLDGAYTLTIYGQSQQSGKLTLTGSEYGKCIQTNDGNIVINGGIVNATADTDGAIKCNSFTMNGGSFSATSNYLDSYYYQDGYAIQIVNKSSEDYGNFTFNGGNFSAFSAYANGIEGYYPTFTLSWTNTSDSFYVSSLGQVSINIAEGKDFIDEDNMLHTYDDPGNIVGKTLRPFNGCYLPKHLTANAITTSTATLTWEAGDEETQWQVSWSTDGGSNWSTPVTVNNVPQYEITGLSPETTVQAQVKSICGESVYSVPISITFTTHSACDAPESLTATPIASSATLNWTGYQDSYNVRYCTVTFGDADTATEDFEHSGSMPEGWTKLDLGDGENTAELGISTDAAQNGTYGFRFSSYNGNSEGSFDQYLISPELNNLTALSFAFKSSQGTNDVFRVGYSTTTNDVSAFTWGDETASANTWSTYTENPGNIPTNAKYFAINYTAVYQYRLYIDNITYTYTPLIVGAWNETNTNVTSPLTISGLTPETPYAWQVQGSNCDGNNGTTEWSEMGTFTTLSSCEVAPSELTATDITATTATLNWNGSQESYNVRYQPVVILNEGFESGTMPDGWTRTGSSLIENYQWQITSGTGHYNCNGAATGNYNAGCFIDAYQVSDILITPVMDLGNVASATLSFNFWNTAWDVDINTLKVYYRVDRGEWHLLYTYGDATDRWIPVTINLEGMAANYQIGFECEGHYSFGMGIDDVKVTGINTSEWTTVTNVSSPHNLTGLMPETQYVWQVQGSNCDGEGSTTEWSEVGTFTTLSPCEVAPSGLTATSTATTATLNWNGFQESYSVRYLPFILYEGFESGTMPDGWTRTGSYWQITSGTGYYDHTGAATGNYNAGCFIGNYVNSDILITPVMDLGNVASATLSFNFWNTNWYGDIDTLNVYYRVNGGEWQSLYTNYDETEGWIPVTINLEGMAAHYQIGFECKDHNSYGMGIDDVMVTGINTSEWTTVTNVSSPHNLTGLTPETQYLWQVQGLDCDGEGSTTEWSEMGIFTTLAGIDLTVAGYGDSDGGYCLIASPNVDNTDPATINGMTLAGDEAVNYDLYRFDPTNEGSEWVNYKADSFNLVNGHGYLYALKSTKTLVFTGPFITDTDSLAVDLEYNATDDHKCWNLVGNPFPCEATINKPYYMLNADGATINPVAISGDTPIPACTAVFVKGESSDDRVVFSKVSAPASSAPIGAIDGLFSVGADKQVYFSQGNLQYQPSTATWRFAPNQYDLLVTPEDLNLYHSAVGNYADVTSLYTENYTDWIDFFGWGTSGWNSGANAYMPYDPSYMSDDFYPGGDYNNDLTGTCANADWAWYNRISNGGNAANQWRTLTHDEWAYLFSGRDGATSKYGHGSVDGVNGMIILPDNWTLPDSCSFTPGNSDWTNSYTTTEWAAMEAAGAVFLPAAGQRSFGTFVNNVGNLGRYWSSTHRNNAAAYDVWFHSDFISELDTQAYYSNRSMGYSVRPVQDAQ